jgi:hypothetical protein
MPTSDLTDKERAAVAAVLRKLIAELKLPYWRSSTRRSPKHRPSRQSQAHPKPQAVECKRRSCANRYRGRGFAINDELASWPIPYLDFPLHSMVGVSARFLAFLD